MHLQIDMEKTHRNRIGKKNKKMVCEECSKALAKCKDRFFSRLWSRRTLGHEWNREKDAWGGRGWRMRIFRRGTGFPVSKQSELYGRYFFFTPWGHHLFSFCSLLRWFSSLRHPFLRAINIFSLACVWNVVDQRSIFFIYISSIRLSEANACIKTEWREAINWVFWALTEILFSR